MAGFFRRLRRPKEGEPEPEERSSVEPDGAEELPVEEAAPSEEFAGVEPETPAAPVPEPAPTEAPIPSASSTPVAPAPPSTPLASAPPPTAATGGGPDRRPGVPDPPPDQHPVLPLRHRDGRTVVPHLSDRVGRLTRPRPVGGTPRAPAPAPL